MAVQTLNIAGRIYQPGLTFGSRLLPATQQYTHVDVTVDFTGWTDPATTEVEIGVQFSLDNGLTWQLLTRFTQTSPPPYMRRNGTQTNLVTVQYDTPFQFDPTHVRGAVRVTGPAVTLGPITINAS